MIPEREREALMRLTMCARGECPMCKYEEQCDNWDFRMELATKNMNILADALRKTEPQTEDLQDWKDRMWTEAVIESQKEREGEINRQDVLTYIDRVANSGMGKKKSLEYIRKYVEKADRKTENSSEIPNNCEWSAEYAKEMLDTMTCEDCGHWEHGAGDHYYCALLEMRQECCFESKDESTLMFANMPKDEPQTESQYDFGEYADRLWKIAYERGKREALEQTEPSCDTCKLKGTTEWCKRQEVCRAYKPKDEPQTERSE